MLVDGRQCPLFNCQQVIYNTHLVIEKIMQLKLKNDTPPNQTDPVLSHFRWETRYSYKDA